MAKLKNKGMDVIIANQVGADQGINSDDNEVTVLWQKAAIMQSLSLARQPKITLAQQLIQLLASLYNNQEHYSEHSSA
jgi:phosphopantothenoylcysteine synthetase/decarboxylase